MEQPHDHFQHRERVRRRFFAENPHVFDDYQLLEVLLFSTKRQGDTNPLAHRLMKKFGTLFALFHATEQEWMEVKGVGPATAVFLSTCRAYFDQAQQELLADLSCDETEEESELVLELEEQMGLLEDGLWVFFLNPRRDAVDSFWLPALDLDACMRRLLSREVSEVRLVWNRRRYTGEPFPNQEQLTFARSLQRRCRSLGFYVYSMTLFDGTIQTRLPYSRWEGLD